MTFDVETKDCTALSDGELAEMADIVADGPAGPGYRFAFQAEGRVGPGHPGPRRGSPARVLVLHPRAHRGYAVRAMGPGVGQALPEREAILDALRADQFRKAVLAFPDEDVLVATRLREPGGFAAFNGPGRHLPAAGLQGLGRGAGMVPAPGQAVRGRGPGRRPQFRACKVTVRPAPCSTTSPKTD